MLFSHISGPMLETALLSGCVTHARSPTEIPSSASDLAATPLHCLNNQEQKTLHTTQYRIMLAALNDTACQNQWHGRTAHQITPLRGGTLTQVYRSIREDHSASTRPIPLHGEPIQRHSMRQYTDVTLQNNTPALLYILAYWHHATE